MNANILKKQLSIGVGMNSQVTFMFKNTFLPKI